MYSSLDMVRSRLMHRRTDKKSDIHWQVSHLKVHTYADSSPRKVGILLDLEHFVSFVGLGILCFCSDPNDPSADAMEKVVRWSSDLNHIMFIFQCGI